ncbi:MAG: DUF6512 family protein [Lachnospiraceae bacterium]|nr:DUF6512 family protein [Lachnospiraceae bacterium]
MNRFKNHVLKKYTIAGVLFVMILGTLSHFFYEWSGLNIIVGLFSPVNESTWEHMKLCFFPMLVYSTFMNRKLKSDFPCITSALLTGILLATFLIPVIFYTYSGILGRTWMPLDITTFFLSVWLAFATVYRLTLSCKADSWTPFLKALVIIIAMCFFIFTYFAPGIGLFAPPSA